MINLSWLDELKMRFFKLIKPDLFGYHLILDLRGCESNTQQYAIEMAVLDLVEMLDMVPIAEMQSIDFKAPAEEDNGPSVIQMIATSHVAAHLFPHKDNYLFVDISSCKQFDVKKVLDYLDLVFKPQSSSVKLVFRGLDFPRG